MQASLFQHQWLEIFGLLEEMYIEANAAFLSPSVYKRFLFISVWSFWKQILKLIHEQHHLS